MTVQPKKMSRVRKAVVTQSVKKKSIKKTVSSGVVKDDAKSKLSAENWLAAAEKAVAAGGFNEARVLPLSKALGVTRGSFYWHFKDHEAFIHLFIERWEKKQLGIMDLWYEELQDPFAATERMLDIVLSDQTLYRKDFKIELAIRNYGSRDQVISQAIQRVDDARRKKLLPILRKASASEAQAQILSYQVYLQTIGAQIILNNIENQSGIKKHMKQSILQLLKKTL